MIINMRDAIALKEVHTMRNVVSSYTKTYKKCVSHIHFPRQFMPVTTLCLANGLYPSSFLRISQKPTTKALEMLLPKLEVNFLAPRHLTRLLDIASCHVGTAKVHSHICAERALQPSDVRPVDDTIAHAA